MEVIQTRFVPGLVFNNQKPDAKDLARFKEPAWNNPVLRFFDYQWKDVVPRKDSVWTTGEVASRLAEVLRAARLKVPMALDLVALENSKATDMATFAMHCYWEGEVQFGHLTGVKNTSSAWYDGKEVVHVEYDPTKIKYKSLVEHALKVRCGSTIYVRTETQKEVASALAPDRVARMDVKEFGKKAKNSDQKYYLSASPMRLVPLTPIQRMKVNSALGQRQSAKKYLSDMQNRMASWILENYEDKNLMKDLNDAQRGSDIRAYFDFVRRRMK